MKKILGLCVISGVLLAACNGGQATQNPAPTTQASETQQGTETNINGAQTKQDYSTQLQALQKKVTDAVAKAEGLNPIGNLDADYKTGTDMLMELEAVSNEVDLLEDEIEYQAKAGNMSDYREDLIQLEKLDHELSRAEDSIEYKFRLDD